MKKRFLAILLCLCMVVALLPTTVFAQDAPTVTVTAPSDNHLVWDNTAGKAIRYEVELNGFKDEPFYNKISASDDRDHIYFITWYKDAAKSEVVSNPMSLVTGPSSTQIVFQINMGSTSNAGTYYFTYSVVEKPYTYESEVMTLIIDKTDHAPLAQKNISIQTAAARTGTITLADIFGTESVPAGAAFKPDTVNGSTNLMESVSVENGALSYISKAGATQSDIYTVAISSTNYNDMNATIVFEPTAQIFAPDAPVMQKPQNGNGQVTLNWAAPANDGGAPVADYLIAYSTTDIAPTDSADWTAIGSTENTYTVTALTNGTAYYFWVKATNGTETSDASESATATPSPTYLTIADNRNEDWDTSGDTLVISTAEDFAQFNWLLTNDDDTDDAQVAGKTIRLSADIDISHYVWTPCSIPENTTFDGCGHTIKYYIDQLSYEAGMNNSQIAINCYAGLFYSAEAGSRICNLHIAGNITLSHASAQVIMDTIGTELVIQLMIDSGLTEAQQQKLLDYYKGQLLNKSLIQTFIGGIVCDADGEEESPAVIDNCKSSVVTTIGTVSGSSADRVYYGGIAAASTNAILQYSEFDGSFIADIVQGSFCGNLIGQPSSTTMRNCVSSGSFATAFAAGAYIGGFAGASDGLEIQNCLFNGTLAVPIKNSFMVAGFVAAAATTAALKIENSLSTGTVGDGYVFIQYSVGEPTTITNSYAIDVNSDKLTGRIPQNAEITDTAVKTEDEIKEPGFAETLNAGQVPAAWFRRENDAPALDTYSQLYTVTFDANGGTAELASNQTNRSGKLDALPGASRTGSYSFNGWYLSDGTQVTLDTVFTEDTTVTAKWTYNGGGYIPPSYYTLRFDTNGGSEIGSISRAYGTTVNLSGYTTTREGYTFNGWYSDEELTDRITSIRMTGSKTVYAGWTENAAPVDNPFTDVSESDWFYDDVMFVHVKKLMVGVSDTLFDPYGTTTRAMTATTLWRMEGSPAPEGGNPFTDVKNGEWYTDAILWAAENEIAEGYGNGLFGTNDPVTREQLAAMFYRYAEYKGYDTTITGSIDRFTDKGDISDWAVDAMKWAVGYGLIQGKDNNILDPKGYATRAEFAAMLHRFI